MTFLNKLSEKYAEHNPAGFFLNSEKVQAIHEYLVEQKLIDRNEKIELVEKPGEGNMNYVIRVRTSSQSYILKQSRPWVEKYPEIQAPEHRVSVEGSFYEKIKQGSSISTMMPELYLLDRKNHVLILEDLGDTKDLTSLYSEPSQLNASHINTLTDFLISLHSSFNAKKETESIKNIEMRQLNHEHIFNFPLLENNGLALDKIQQGLQEISIQFKKNGALVEKARALGDIYLDNGDYLLHGDFYPGSWLKTESGLKVIDPEFCFFGPQEFDLGVFVAHLYMAEVSTELIHQLLERYQSKMSVNRELLLNFTGIEIIRRILGVAQLPLDLSVEEKEIKLNAAQQMLLGPDNTILL